MYQVYQPNDYNVWLSYYGNQALQTGFGIEAYRGTPYQRGAGLGSFFRALFRMAVPVMKSVGKKVGKHALSAGANVIADVARGQPVLDSMKKHSRAETSRMLAEAGEELQEGEGLGTSINTRKKRGKPINNDIFTKR